MNIDESLTAKGYTPAAQVPQVFGQARVVKSITIHWWGSYGQTHDGVCAFFCTTGPGQTSAHYVASDGRVNCIVNPDDAAWHSGTAEGNATSIGIECRPEATDGDYSTIAELIRDIRAIYGDIPLYPHNHWFNTACPGDYDLARLDSLARGTITTQSATITPLEDTLSAESEANIIAAVNFAFERIKTELPNDTAAAVLGQPVPYKDPVTGADMGQTTSLGTVAGFTDFQHNATRSSVPAAVLNQAFTLPDGTLTNLAGILSAINARPVTAGTVVNAPATDPQTIAEAVLFGIQTQWSK